MIGPIGRYNEPRIPEQVCSWEEFEEMLRDIEQMVKKRQCTHRRGMNYLCSFVNLIDFVVHVEREYREVWQTNFTIYFGTANANAVMVDGHTPAELVKNIREHLLYMAHMLSLNINHSFEEYDKYKSRTKKGSKG